jgi:integrase
MSKGGWGPQIGDDYASPQLLLSIPLSTITCPYCAVLTGMRRGELLALRSDDIDVEQQQIHVRRALWRGQMIPPKPRRA